MLPILLHGHVFWVSSVDPTICKQNKTMHKITAFDVITINILYCLKLEPWQHIENCFRDIAWIQSSESDCCGLQKRVIMSWSPPYYLFCRCSPLRVQSRSEVRWEQNTISRARWHSLKETLTITNENNSEVVCTLNLMVRSTLKHHM